MGVCASSDEKEKDLKNEKRNDKMIDQKMMAQDEQERQINKLLLLGAGASGKSTLFKQMITIYGKGFSENERKTYTNIIYNNILTAMKQLVKQSVRYGEISPSLARSKSLLEADMKEDEVITEELGQHIKQLWSDPTIQLTFEHQHEYQLTDSAKYFFERINEISTFGYIPTEQDVLRSRAPTTGIVESAFSIDGNHFKMFDVGGQRNERKKWIHCFENVTAVLFVAALSEYNQVLYEDETQNRLIESLTLFEEICNSKWLRRTSMILFLNKRDIFLEKIAKFPLADYFAEYNYGPDYEGGVQWIREQFESKNAGAQDNEDRTIYTHITCATDKNNVTAVFNAVKDIIIKKNLARVGLM